MPVVLPTVAQERQKPLLVQFVGVFRARFSNRYNIAVLQLWWLAAGLEKFIESFVDLIASMCV